MLFWATIGRMKWRIGLVLVVILGIGGIVLSRSHTAKSTPKKHSTASTIASSGTSQVSQSTPAGFNKNQYSLTDPASIWIVVNTLRPLIPKTYVPSDLVVPNIPHRSNITSTEK